MSSADARKISIQEREVQRYYTSWLSAHGSGTSVARHVESIANLEGRGYRPKVSRDKALTAFAQLAAIRLNVKREATKDTSVKDPHDLWLGTTTLVRATAVCEHCFLNEATAQDQSGAFSTPGLIVNDCRLDDRFKDRPYVEAEPGVRFYAGVPIVSRSGILIGAYAVSHEQPRDGLSVNELKFMQETAEAVMDHLEWARDRVDRYKGDKIVRGMATFIDACGQSNPDEPLPKPAHQPTLSTATPYPTNARTRDAGIFPAGISAGLRGHEKTDFGSRKRSRSPPPHSHFVSSNSRAPPQRPKTLHRTQSSKNDSISNMFVRAADILRESALADGACIFGASAGAPTHRSIRRVMADGKSTSQLPPGTDSSADPGTSDSDTTPSGRPCKVLACSLADEQAKDEIEQESALTLGTLEKYFTLFPRGKVFYFTSQGFGVSSDDDGSTSESQQPPKEAREDRRNVEQGSSSNRRKKRKRFMDHEELLKKIPGAKSVVFLPLYDYVEEKLMAGCFLWSSTTGQMMNLDDDLSYLRAFGNCIMSEVARMNVQKNEAAKTTFIASMSHELRSPLHGILGASEFLVDTATDSYQSGLITSIVTCGKTLLDTLNHVLDYSKINKLGRAQMRRNAKTNKLVTLDSDPGLESINMTAEVDLGILVEEVVEAVTAGHAFRKLQHGTSIGKTASKDSANGLGPSGVLSVNTLSGAAEGFGSIESASGSVSVMLDIDPRDSWVVRTQPGALRRIIMNLLGNALKYTPSGFVVVSLEVQEAQSDKTINAVVRVVDSGKGMSEDFQKNRLFVPFSQEDSFQPGTGLGLSIVKQIVDSLGGSIEIKSEPGKGTEVDVDLCLAAVSHESNPDHMPSDEHTSATRERIKGMRVFFLDPFIQGHQRPKNDRMTRLTFSLKAVFEKWFDMKCIVSSEMDHADADFYLYAEPPGIDELVEHANSGRLTKPCGRVIPVIIICLSAEEAIDVSRNHAQALRNLGTIVEVIPQPCGPRKLGVALRQCLKRLDSGEQRDEKNGTKGNGRDASQPAENHKPVSQRERAGSGNGYEPDDEGTRSQARNKPFVPGESSDANEPSPCLSPPPLDPATPSLAQVIATPSTDGSGTMQHNETSAVRPDEAALHILLVDDNKINLQLLQMFVKKSHFTFVCAENGLEAVEAYKATVAEKTEEYFPSVMGSSRPPGRFDYVFMDVSMPVMNGLDATKEIREIEQRSGIKRTKVIALTGLASKEARKQAETAGVDIFLPKPVKFAELKKLLVVR
ncbi:hypothetical protein LTS14_002430 [Recurvomyces mirabilis]|uniref:uncharacterized protein n=1 Tax=Recurvomyces mirabilis TaxID=574656 RepID=UPI002DE18DB9|nr:hypothetical protein LTS14_002430 [Recurvomyces mirabilis]